MRTYALLLLYLFCFISCNKHFSANKRDVIIAKEGAILLMSKEYYFVEKKFNNDNELITFIKNPDKIVYNLKHRLACQFDEVLHPSKFNKLGKNIIPELSSPNSDSELRYLNATIKLIQDEVIVDGVLRNIELRDYDNLENTFNLKYKIEPRTLYVVIPDNAKD